MHFNYLLFNNQVTSQKANFDTVIPTIVPLLYWQTLKSFLLHEVRLNIPILDIK